MILFKKVRWRNLLSYGNNWTELQLDEAKDTLMVGSNGHGKSAVVEAITFSLYGRPFRNINKPQLVNSTNQKDLLTEIEFEVHPHSYLVRRGMKPNVFEIYKNGKLLDQAASIKDYQTMLETQILSLSYKAFTQIVILGTATHVPFMQLPLGQRRELIEDLLDIQVFTTMNTLLKDKTLQAKNDLNDTKHRIRALGEQLKLLQTHSRELKNLKQSQIDGLKTKLAETEVLLETIDTTIEIIDDSFSKLSNKLQGKATLTKKLSTYAELKRDLSVKISAVKNEIDFYAENNNCPTCKQGIAHDFKDHVISTKESKSNELYKAIEKLDGNLSELQDELAKYNELETQAQELISKRNSALTEKKLLETSKKSIRQELVSLEKEIVDMDLSKIKTVRTELQTETSKHEDLLKNIEIFSIAGSLLKDGGIKTKVIQQYVPVMNKLINQYLTAMDFFVDFRLDETFNEKIFSRHRDEFTYASFSEGEKLRLDLAIMFTWRAISKLRNSISTNLLIMDEILDSSLDQQGTDDFLKILKELTTDSNVFIISHKGDSLHDKFDRILRFEKVKNFSQMIV
jgi:DNA repair exonuclease SbcCD ATPase subunit